MNAAVSRRQFLKNSTLVAASAAAVTSFPNILHAQTKPKLNAAVIGLGGRGSGASKDFLDAAKEVGADASIIALADMFPDQVNRCRQNLGRLGVEVPTQNCFSGFDAYLKALAVPGVNYVILATPPGFRAAHFKAAVAAGKNIFTEKPVAVDGPGCRIMYAAAEESKKKGLKVVAGTQRRHHPGYIETIKRIHDGAIGDVTALRAYWVNTGPIWHRGVKGDTDLERQINNWYHYIWLCGDHIAEQHVHNIDVCNWVMKGHPVKAWGMGGRQQLGNKPGEIWDNFAVEFEYANGVRMASYCGQIKRDFGSVSEAVVGSKGTANPAGQIRPTGGEAWRAPGKKLSEYVYEHISLINAIIKDTPINEAAQVTDSTLTAIMGREAAYGGGVVEWDEMLNSTFAYGPDLLYTDASKMTFGDFRTLKPPMPGQHDIFAKPPQVPTV
ncbi:MAG TPA: Gfo/Idh/MocA family oxidoreductase [Verrucomicrobiae bacterium]|nr:Gfo/Idh/MocA family oxidoreductase [Verrucomicrobiae bacterium]